jgi:hypothetical protein
MFSFAPARHLILAAAAVVTVMPITTIADTYVERANALYATIRPQNRSDVILLPAVARMEKPPAAVADPEKAMLLPTRSSSWEAARAWATSQPQVDVLEALKRAAHAESRTELRGFGQPYGVDAVSSGPDGIALVRAGLYTELGDPPTLAAAKFLYLPALENVACLVHVEATRRAAEGDIPSAISVVTDWLLFSRQMADREFFKEARWGLRQMVASLERIRDLAYQDFRGSKTLRVEQIQQILDLLRLEHADLAAERMTFPRADKIGADHVIALTFTQRAGTNQQFAPTLARLSANERPLRLFAEAATWDQYAKMHANWFDTTDRVEKVYSDFASRWPIDPHDPRHNVKTDYETSSRTQYAAIFAVLPDMSVLVNDRQVVRAHIAGTRTSLGILGFFYRNGSFPPDVSSIRPTFVRTIEADPFNRARTRPLEYFVPIRDQPLGPREEPRPHTVNVVTREGQYNFQVRMGDDQFVLYSIGPDGKKDWATIVSDEPAKGAAGDLLLWPPTVSLLRQRLIETNALK